MEKKCNPKEIIVEYRNAVNYKSQLGTRGLYEQNKINERFMVGDQWHGAKCGADRPLVRHNVIKRIGDYKMAVVGSRPIAVNYSADGVPNTLELKEKVQRIRDGASNGFSVIEFNDKIANTEEINIVMSALSDYFRVTSERVKFDDLKEQVLRDAYVTGTGVLYTYFDEKVRTGLYADESRKTPIKGDIVCEVLNIEDVYFGDPSVSDLQKQPYIILAQRRPINEIKRIMRAHGQSAHLDEVKPDSDTSYQAGQYGETEQMGTKRATLLTKLYKEWDEKGEDFKVMAVMVCGETIVRPSWDIGIRLYPLASFRWERRKSCAYGESEITYLIPNQIAINRMITASVWAVMMMGMPIMLVNGDIVHQPITNEPGQIVKVNGSINDIQGAVRYLNPPNFSPNFDNNIASLIANTLTQSGANDSALGDVNPENTSAIIAVREAATMPMQTVQNRFFSFVEDVARIWAEFWVRQYGKRSLKIEENNGSVWYMPFDGKRYEDLLINARIDIGASTLWSEAQSIRTLDNLFDRQVIDVFQYLKRLPKGTVPNVNGLIREIQNANQAVAEQTGVGGAITPPDVVTEEDVINGLDEESRAIFDNIPEQAKAALLKNAIQQGGIT
jgi:hypothetical protein